MGDRWRTSLIHCSTFDTLGKFLFDSPSEIGSFYGNNFRQSSCHAHGD